MFRVLLAEEPGELTELILNTSMSELEYRRVGRCLEVLREQDVLVICLDDKPCHREADGVSLHDRHLRELLSAWAQDQQWVAVMSFKGDAAGSTQTNRLDDPTVCLLKRIGRINALFTQVQQLWTAVDSFDTPAMQPNPADGEPATLKIYPPLSH